MWSTTTEDEETHAGTHGRHHHLIGRILVGGGLARLVGYGGPRYFAWLDEDAAGNYTSLMGATTYRLFAGFVESGEEDINALTAMDKIVFSSTLEAPLTWANTRLVSDDAVDVVRGMKQDGDISLRTIGSLSLCRSLLVAGLVDRLRVVVFRWSMVRPPRALLCRVA